MRRVASRAIPDRRRVSPFLLQSGFQILMAGQTQVRTFRVKKARQLCLVRVVACRAVRGFDGRVLALCSLDSRLEIGMARGTEGSLWIGNHPSDIAAM